MLVVADGGRGDGEVVEELLGLAGVFAGDAVNVFENVEGAEGDVAEVADGGGDEIEAGGEWSVGHCGIDGKRGEWFTRTPVEAWLRFVVSHPRAKDAHGWGTQICAECG